MVLNGIENIVELPHTIEIKNQEIIDNIYIGRRMMKPASAVFTLWWRDRHSMLWDDVNGDGHIDVYIARGGVRGKLDLVREDIHDEVMLSENGVFVDSMNRFGINKGTCPARQGAWVDYNSNGQLDLYLVCGRMSLLEYPNMLLRRKGVFNFEEIAGSTGLDYKGRSKFKWYDTENDGDMDLLAIEDQQIALYRNSSGKFEREIVEDNVPEGYVKLTLSDYDNDGFLDAFAVSRHRNLLLKNEAGNIVARDAQKFGLPTGAREANWVDYDNDGLSDIHIVPGGLFKQGSDNRFTSTELLNEGEPLGSVSSALCNWFDMDNDGYRDVVCALERYPEKEIRVMKKMLDRGVNTRYWTEYSFRNLNVGNSNNWLEIDVEGDRENRFSIGARVEVITGDKTFTSVVGQSDGAHFSQGHYRLYFGLGNIEKIDTIRVTWSDGFTRSMDNIAVRQLLTFRKFDS